MTVSCSTPTEGARHDCLVKIMHPWGCISIILISIALILREDFISPLRKGISDFKEGKTCTAALYKSLQTRAGSLL